MQNQRWFYALEYPEGHDRRDVKYPYVLTVHRYPAVSARNAAVRRGMVQQRENEGPELPYGLLRWHKSNSTSRGVIKARLQAEAGEQWPIKVTIEHPRPQMRRRYYYAFQALYHMEDGRAIQDPECKIHRFMNTLSRDRRVEIGGSPYWHKIAAGDSLVTKAKAKAQETPQETDGEDPWPITVTMPPPK